MFEKYKRFLSRWHHFKQDMKQQQPVRYFILETLETVGVALVIALFVKTYFFQTSLVFSGSMIPTMKVNDRLIVNKTAFWFHHRPERFEIVLFKSPMKDKKEYVKRLIAFPGERVEIRRGIVFVDGEQLILPGIDIQRDYSYFGPEVVPQDSYFVLGDNRGNSADSRVWGYVPHKDLIGKAVFTFWPLSRAQVLR